MDYKQIEHDYVRKLDRILESYDKGEITFNEALKSRREEAWSSATEAPLEKEDKKAGYNNQVYWDLMDLQRDEFYERSVENLMENENLSEKEAKIVTDFSFSLEGKERLKERLLKNDKILMVL